VVSKALSQSARTRPIGPLAPHWLKFKNPEASAVKREAEEDWGGDMRAQPLFLKGPKLSQIKRDHA
jgi:hypothetical protein